MDANARIPLLEAEVARLSHDLSTIDRQWKRKHLLALFGLAAIPAYFFFGPPAAGGGTVTISAYGDFDANDEFLFFTLDDFGNPITHSVLNGQGQQRYARQTVNVTQGEIESLLANGLTLMLGPNVSSLPTKLTV